jgi:Conjugal transfer protein
MKGIRTAFVPLAAFVAAGAGCSADTSVKTTPTFSAARYLPAAPTGPQDQAGPSGPTPEPRPERARGLTGVKAVSAANREATVEPDDASMRGATWYIEDVQPTLIYRVCTATRRVTTILLPPGERFNGAVGGDVDAFLINVAYAGPRPAVSILPRTPCARGNLQLVTTGGFYSYSLGACETALNLVDVARKDPPARSAASLPQPEGDFTRLALVREDGPLPAWAPAEVWADSVKMVVRFDGPLPVLPTLFAGRQGEQVVNYRSLADGRQVYLITSRRVTEAELRLGAEKVRITVDGDAVRAGTAADPARGADGWKPAGAVADPPPPARPFPAAAPRQPMAGNPVLGVSAPPAAVRL